MRILLFILTMLATPLWAAEAPANHLKGQTSPYLLQHLDNPVDWYPWGPEALDKARAEGKLIFISIGYSSCHWCHVMERESFENPKIAAYLNRHFVAILIDREERPDLDDQFMRVTELITGSGGWPNSVFLTPDGKPFYGGSYFPPDAFMSVLTQVVGLWKDDRAYVESQANRTSTYLRSQMTPFARDDQISPARIREAALEIAAQVDEFSGGLGDSAKFPREPLFLFLLNQAERSGDRPLLAAVGATLDGMIIGGIHDHVGGGFFRYATDPAWHVPHFEKMLYDQALIGRLLVRMWKATGRLRYRRAAERLFAFVLRDMQAPDGGFYSALDADSLDDKGRLVEGAYYSWIPEELTPLGKDADFAARILQIVPHGEIDGRSVPHLSALPDELAAEQGMDEAAFYARLDGVLEHMRQIRAKRPAPHLDRKIVLAWNAEMIATLAEASWLLDRPDLYDAAARAARRIMDRMSAGDGMARVMIQGRARVPAQLPDYAAFGLALVALHDYAPAQGASDRGRKGWLKGAQRMADGIGKRFGKPAEGFHMTEAREGFSSQVPMDDTEIASGNALALALFARLDTRLQAPRLRLQADALAAALVGHAIEIPDQRAGLLDAAQERQVGSAAVVRYGAHGVVRVEFHRNAAEPRLALRISLARGWHVNANKPLQDYLVPTRLTIAGNEVPAATYPRPVVKALRFNDTPLALYEGVVDLAARLPPDDGMERAPMAELTFQACSDRICLDPQKMRFALW